MNIISFIVHSYDTHFYARLCGKGSTLLDEERRVCTKYKLKNYNTVKICCEKQKEEWRK